MIIQPRQIALVMFRKVFDVLVPVLIDVLPWPMLISFGAHEHRSTGRTRLRHSFLLAVRKGHRRVVKEMITFLLQLIIDIQ
jgi:hypothetical protein